MNLPVEKKVALPAFTGAVVSLAVYLLTQYVHGFTAPSPPTMALIVTVVSGLVGYLAPHTSRPKLLTPAETALLDNAKTQVTVQPSSTTTGPASPATTP